MSGQPVSLAPVPRGLLLLAHGARDPAWALPFRAVAARIASARPALRVELAFLEFMAPSLSDAGHALAHAGCTVVDVVPLFLGGGGHVRRDVPPLVAQLCAGHPGCDFRLHPAAGEADRVIDALAGAALDAVDLPALPLP